MANIGDIVLLRSGGPKMVISYILRGGEGSREKAAALKGFKKGDVLCEWQHMIAEDKIKTMRETFKASMLMDINGVPLAEPGGGDDDDDDDW